MAQQRTIQTLYKKLATAEAALLYCVPLSPGSFHFFANSWLIPSL